MTTTGQQLRKEREARALTIDQVATATRIRAHYLSAIESGELEALPSNVHARGFLRAYADFLGLDPEPMITELDGKAPVNVQPDALVPPPAIDTQNHLPKKAGEIFSDIGAQLHRQRELLGLSLEDVERHTHLRQHYLRSLEAGDLQGLPSPVQGRGMLDNYASFLGMNADALLLRFAEGLQAQLEARRLADTTSPKPAPAVDAPSMPGPLRRLFSADILIGGSAAVFLLVFVFWGIIRIFGMVSTAEPTPTAPSIAEVLLATPTTTETYTPEPVTATSPSQAQLFPTLPIATGTLPEGAVPVQSGAAVQVYLTVRQRAWMRVLVDGEIQFDGRVLPGSAYPFIGDNQVEILTGNGTALLVFYNGADLGPMGNQGQIVDQIFTPQGVFTPTPTITMTPTPTQPIPATPGALDTTTSEVAAPTLTP